MVIQTWDNWLQVATLRPRTKPLNDIEMLETVGCGIAMGNALDEVKKYADKVTDTVQNHGVAIGIEKYILS